MSYFYLSKKEQDRDIKQRAQFTPNYKKAIEKMSIKVEWNGKIFPSLNALGNHLRVNGCTVSKYMKLKKPLKGYIVKRVEK